LVGETPENLGSGHFHLVESYGATRLRVDPQEGVFPIVRELNLDRMVAPWASRPPRLEDRVWALALAVDTFQDKLSPFITGNPRRTASFTEGSHFLHQSLAVSS